MTLLETFRNPPREFTIIPFWFLNDDLCEEELRRQIDDFAAHGVYGFIPHARIGLPRSIGFMSDRWLHFVQVCVEHAADLGMLVILYDEGMYPSGSCAGQVVAENPAYATRCLRQRQEGPLGEDEHLVAETGGFLYVNCPSNGRIRGVHYGSDDGEPGAPPSADLLNPEAVRAFLRLVPGRYHEALAAHFGSTIIGIFTDEPDLLGRGRPDGVRPWTWGFEEYLQQRTGEDFCPHLPSLFDPEHPEHKETLRIWARAVDSRLQETYYQPYSAWCRDHGIALTGHPAGPEDIGVLRHFQIPGQDVVWRYIEPFQAKTLEGSQSTMAKCSFSAKLHGRRARNANECFGAYGWEFTEDEMWWITNWLLVRGVDMLIPHAFYYSLREARRNERPPDVGPNSPWWPHYADYANYCRRLCWMLAEGHHICDVALLASSTHLPWRTAKVLFQAQRDFVYLDTDTLRTACRVTTEGIHLHDHSYRVLLVEDSNFLDAAILETIGPLREAGRLLCADELSPGEPAPFMERLEALCAPDVVLAPANSDLRYVHVRHGTAHFYLFANEGREPIRGRINVAAQGAKRAWWDPRTLDVKPARAPAEIQLDSYRTLVLYVAE